MSASVQPIDARRYLLGEASDDECEAIEQKYFARTDAPEAIDAIEVAEETLIEDFLERRLTAHERERFEQHYLSTPDHRTRVETIRRLKRASPSVVTPIPIATARPLAVGPSRARSLKTIALAAVLVIGVGASLWFARDRGDGTEPGSPAGSISTTPGVTSPPAPRVFAMSISPVAVRSAADSPALVVPPGTDLVDLRLEGEAANRPSARARVVVRTVAGDEVWQGPPASATGLPPGVIARAEIPAARLGVDDYVVTLFEIGPAGTETEKNRYFLRVRAR